LSIPPVRDRIVQAAVKIVLEPVFEADFLPCSFGFRPGRSPQVLAAALSAHRSAAFDVHVLAGSGCRAAEVAGSGFAVVVAGEEAGERVDEVE
jgi:hypothetical protein